MDSGLSLALAIIIGSVFLVTVMTAQSNLHELKIENFLENLSEEKLEAAKSVIKWHVEKIGYNIKSEDLTFGEQKLYEADNTTILKFYSDIDDDGTVDYIELYSGSTSDMASTDNPNDFYLYRKVNYGTPEVIAVGLTYLNFKSYSTNSSDNNQIEVSVLVQTPYSMSYRNGTTRYFQSEWFEKICPDNLGWY